MSENETRAAEGWALETMRLINELTPEVKGKAFDPDWFLLRVRLEKAERDVAAAPELLEAAQHAAKSHHHPACKCHGEYSGNPERYCTCHVQKARAALAKATGEGEGV